MNTAAAEAATTTVKFSEIRGNLYTALTGGLTITEYAYQSLRSYARSDWAVIAPHAAGLATALRHAYADRILRTYAGPKAVSVNIAGDVIGIPDDTLTIKVVKEFLDGMLRDLETDMFVKIRRIIDEAKAA